MNSSGSVPPLRGMWLIIAWLSPTLLPATQRVAQYVVSALMPNWFQPPSVNPKLGALILAWAFIAMASSAFIAWDLQRDKPKNQAGDFIAFFTIGILCAQLFFTLTIGLMLAAMVENLFR